MFARVNTIQGSPDQVDQAIADVRERVLPGIQAADGFRGLMVLVDRTSGKSLGITLWESEEARRASEETAGRLRTETTEATGGQVVSVEHFEVALDERR